ncbi:Uncharacterised protein [Moraxella lacunata]|uniref:Uncharacterized protein n=1 Tax=Moraxella lacunata TaxID=477 RepID=A0A378T866_MORLA|nr:DUF5691 domain-containing protein [Moraxella lacunata]STZ56055.1 Uncharacterised protein [Moraxella lacunata]
MINKEKIDQFYAKLMIANDGISEPLPFGDELSTLGKITLISQYETMMYDHAPSGELTRAKPLPELDLPVLPKHLWRLLGQVFEQCRDNYLTMVRLLMFIYKRGYGVPPTVWLPPKQMKTNFNDPDGMNFEGELPSPYLAWLAWVNGEQTTTPDESLTADNWDEFYPAERIQLLKNLRQSDPKTALDLIANFAPSEVAEKRLDLVEVLSINLSDDDKAFLQSLHKDRSQKVKELAKTLLARLGEFDNEDKLADDLFDELEMTGDGISFKATKNNKKRQNNFENLKKVNLFALAKKFELSFLDFVLAWDFKHGNNYHHYYDVNAVLLERAVPLLGDEEVQKVATMLMPIMLKNSSLYWQKMRARLPVSFRQEFADKLFTRGEGFLDLLSVMPNQLQISAKALQISSSYKKMIANIQKWQEKNSGYIDDYHICQEVRALGLLVGQDTAKECLAHLETLGIMKTDPVLSVLHLNALLDNKD